MTRPKIVFQTEILDADDESVHAVVRRWENLDYVSITRDDNVITVPLDRVPELMRALLAAANR